MQPLGPCTTQSWFMGRADPRNPAAVDDHHWTFGHRTRPTRLSRRRTHALHGPVLLVARASAPGSARPSGGQRPLRASQVLAKRSADYLGDRGAIGLCSLSGSNPKVWLQSHGLHRLGCLPQRRPTRAPRPISQLTGLVTPFCFVGQLLDVLIGDPAAACRPVNLHTG